MMFRTEKQRTRSSSQWHEVDELPSMDGDGDNDESATRTMLKTEPPDFNVSERT